MGEKDSRMTFSVPVCGEFFPLLFSSLWEIFFIFFPNLENFGFWGNFWPLTAKHPVAKET